MEFLVDRLNAGAALGGGVQWRGGENLRRLWADGHDPARIVMDEAHRLGMDFWLQLRMNDWHHVDSEGKVYRLIGSDYYEQHPELLIGKEGVAGWPERLQESMAWFQDFAHEKVRRIRLDTATEAIERYDAEGLGVRLHALPRPVPVRPGACQRPPDHRTDPRYAADAGRVRDGLARQDPGPVGASAQHHRRRLHARPGCPGLGSPTTWSTLSFLPPFSPRTPRRTCASG